MYIDQPTWLMLSQLQVSLMEISLFPVSFDDLERCVEVKIIVRPILSFIESIGVL